MHPLLRKALGFFAILCGIAAIYGLGGTIASLVAYLGGARTVSPGYYFYGALGSLSLCLFCSVVFAPKQRKQILAGALISLLAVIAAQNIAPGIGKMTIVQQSTDAIASGQPVTPSPTAAASPSASATPPSISITSAKVSDPSQDLEFTKSSDVGVVSSGVKAQFSGIDLRRCWADTDSFFIDVHCTLSGDTTRFDPGDADQSYGWTLDYTGNKGADLWVLVANDYSGFNTSSTLLPSYSALEGQARVRFDQSGDTVLISIPVDALEIDSAHLSGKVPVTICAYAKLQAFSGASWVKGFDVLKSNTHCVQKHTPAIKLLLQEK
jgi:hypothetical protein